MVQKNKFSCNNMSWTTIPESIFFGAEGLIWQDTFSNDVRDVNVMWTSRHYSPRDHDEYFMIPPWENVWCEGGWGALRGFKASFYNPENRLNFPKTDCFRRKISMELFYQYMAIFFNFSPTSNHLHPLEVENCDSNSRLVVDEDDNGKFRPERVSPYSANRVLIIKAVFSPPFNFN